MCLLPIVALEEKVLVVVDCAEVGEEEGEVDGGQAGQHRHLQTAAHRKKYYKSLLRKKNYKRAALNLFSRRINR